MGSFGPQSSTTIAQDAGLLRAMSPATGNPSVSLEQSWVEPGSNLSKPLDAGEKNWPSLLILVIILLTTGGNILVIMAVSLEKKLQNATNFFLRSLAVADMLVGILVMPVSLITILHDHAWPLPNPLCPVWIYLDVLFSTSSIMHLCAISLDRYVGIRNPLEYSRFNSRTTAILKIVAVWTISVVISMPIPVIGLLDQNKVFVNGSCVLNEPSFVLLGSFVAFFIPLVIMVVTYCLTVRALQRQASNFMHGSTAPGSLRPLRAQSQAQRGRLLCLRRNVSQDSAGGKNISIIARSKAPEQLSSPSCQDLGRERGMIQAIKNERRASKVLGVVFFLFLVMWCPFFITNVMNAFCNGGCNQPLLGELLNVFVWVGYSSSGVNPLIYTLFNKTYRRAFSRYMRCRYSALPAKPLLGRGPCPSHMGAPASFSSKSTVDRNSNCQNGNGKTLSGQELDGTDEGLDVQSGASRVFIESGDASRSHTSSM